jgi:glycosyltransferase involved in cell wall biosynthesis
MRERRDHRQAPLRFKSFINILKQIVMRNLKLSVVVCTKDRKDKAVKCITAVVSQSEKPSEVIIVDSSSTKDLCEPASTILEKGGIRFVYDYFDCSMTVARNRGIKKSSGDIVLFLDDDVVLYPDYIEKLIEFYREYPEAGGACGYLCDGNRFLIDRLMKFPRIPALSEPFTIISLHGSNMSFKREVFDHFTFNEDLRGYYADDDEFCARASQRYKLYLVPGIRCVHEHTPTGGARQEPYTMLNTMMFNRYYVYRQREKNLFNFMHYIFSELMVMVRILVVFRGNKARALSGAFRGYERVLKNIFKADLTQELKRL